MVGFTFAHQITNNMKEIIKAETFGITKEKEQELLVGLPQIKEERKVLEDQYSEVIKLDIDNPETAKVAKKLRLLIKTNRTQGIQTWHKNAKEFFLRGGQFCDAVKNMEIAVNERMESKLEEIEKHQELKEQQRISELQKERADMLRPYIENPDLMALGMMDAEVFKPFYESKKKAYYDLMVEKNRLIQEQRKKDAQEKLFNERALMLAKYEGITILELSLETLEQDFINEIEHCKEVKAKKDAEAEILRQEQQAREELRKQRAEEVKPFIMFVSDYEGVLIAEPENYSQLLQDAKDKKDAHDKAEAIRKQQEEDARLKLMQDRLKLREERLFNIGAHKQSDQYFIDCLKGSVINIMDVQCLVDEQFDRVFDSIKKRVEDFEAAEEAKKQKALELAEKKANRAPDKVKLQAFLDGLVKPEFPTMKTQEGINALQEVVKAYTNFIDVIQEQIASL